MSLPSSSRKIVRCGPDAMAIRRLTQISGRAPARGCSVGSMVEATSSRALVVDDEVWVRKFIREVLEEEGFEVVEAADGKAAARMLRESTNFALIVTDILMPDEDGLELIRELDRILIEV